MNCNSLKAHLSDIFNPALWQKAKKAPSHTIKTVLQKLLATFISKANHITITNSVYDFDEPI